MVASDILMGFFDLVPVGLFLAASIILQRDLYNKMSKGAFSLFASGTIVVFVAGLLKAIYKILLTLRICDFEPLNKCFFPMETVGFVLAGAGMLAVLFYHQGKGTAYCIALPTLVVLAMQGDYSDVEAWSGTMLFVVLMCLGVLAMNFGLFTFGLKMKNVAICIVVVVSFIGTLGMGYLSTKDGMNDWIKEVVNTIGQGSLLASAILLRKNGLGKADFNVSLLK